LSETTEGGRRFVASLSVTVTEDQVIVYVTLEVGSSSTQINVVDVDQRCPSIVRTLLTKLGPWFHGPTHLLGLQRMAGFAEGERLAAMLREPDRRVPVVVASAGGPPELRDLGTPLAYDLAGLANVVTIDAEAAWALTDTLGIAFTCHSGAVRIFWPGLSSESKPYQHPLWTSRRILGRADGKEVETLRNQLRRTVMSASATSVVRPAAIDEIRAAASMARFEGLRATAASVEEWERIAELYADENIQLRTEVHSLEEKVAELSESLRVADSDRAALKYQLRTLGQETQDAADEIEPDVPDEAKRPVSGEVRFYKKKHSTPHRDVLVHVADCGHDRWKSAAKADKAKKGIAWLEGTDAWSTVQHCPTCTGGGMWRVKW
jgi:hypothetical protein